MSNAHSSPRLLRSIIAMATVLLLATQVYAADTRTHQPKSEDKEKTWLKIGTSPGNLADMTRDIFIPAFEAHEDPAYRLDLTTVLDVGIANVSVEQKTLDFNIVQHRLSVEKFNEDQDSVLYPLAQVPTVPYGLYPGRLKRLADIKQGATIAIPSGSIDFARGLRMLENLGWIQLRTDLTDPYAADIKDIINNPYHLEIKKIPVSSIASRERMYDYRIITGTYAYDAKIPLSEMLYQEPGRDFINWIVINQENREKPWVKLMQKIADSAEFKAYSYEKFPGFLYPSSWEKNPKR